MAVRFLRDLTADFVALMTRRPLLADCFAFPTAFRTLLFTLARAFAALRATRAGAVLPAGRYFFTAVSALATAPRARVSAAWVATSALSPIRSPACWVRVADLLAASCNGADMSFGVGIACPPKRYRVSDGLAAIAPSVRPKRRPKTLVPLTLRKGVLGAPNGDGGTDS